MWVQTGAGRASASAAVTAMAAPRALHIPPLLLLGRRQHFRGSSVRRGPSGSLLRAAQAHTQGAYTKLAPQPAFLLEWGSALPSRCAAACLLWGLWDSAVGAPATSSWRAPAGRWQGGSALGPKACYSRAVGPEAWQRNDKDGLQLRPF